MDDEKLTFDRLSVENLRDEFHDVVKQIVDKANEAIDGAETTANKYIEQLVDSKEKIEKLEKESTDAEAQIDQLRSIRKQQIDFEAVERLINFAPGDPGQLYPLHERVEKVIARANADRKASEQLTYLVSTKRDKLQDELAELKAAIIPELERLEGHERRLRVIVEMDVKDKHLPALLRDAKNAF